MKLILRSGFRESKSQIQFDDLSIQIKDLESGIKNVNSTSTKENGRLTVFDISFNSHDYKYFEKKIIEYNQLLDYKLTELNSYNRSVSAETDLLKCIGQLFDETGLELEKEIQLIKKLIALASEFLKTGNFFRRKNFDELENKLYKRFKLDELKFTRFFSEILCNDLFSKVDNLGIRLNKLRKILRQLRRKLFIFFTRDIRHVFRSIIRFLFKNMNDESGLDKELFFSNLKQSPYQIFQFHYNGKQRNHRTFTNYSY